MTPVAVATPRAERIVQALAAFVACLAILPVAALLLPFFAAWCVYMEEE